MKEIGAKDDFVVFDKEQALASIRKSKVYGWTQASAIQCWPSVAELRTKSEETLSKLRIKKLEWWTTINESICSIRLTLNDGTVSPQIGTRYCVNKSFDFPQEKPITTIRVRADGGSCVNQLEFLDKYGELIYQIIGYDSGDWHSIEVKDGETFIGFQETHSEIKLRAIGFLTMKQKD